MLKFYFVRILFLSSNYGQCSCKAGFKEDGKALDDDPDVYNFEEDEDEEVIRITVQIPT